MPEAVPKVIETLIDRASFEPSSFSLPAADPLGYPGYADAVEAARRRSGSPESASAGAAAIGDIAIEIAAFDFSFLGGSMGTATGEVLALALERAAARKVPFVLRTATGGARMQEGMASLVQMPKVVTARIELARARQPFVVVLGHPTTGGVLASLGGLADVTIAEEGATIGFAGPRVVESVTGRRLADDSHTAESAAAAGLVDVVAAAGSVRSLVHEALAILTHARTPAAAEAPSPAEPGEADAWEALQRVRSDEWPSAPEIARAASTSWFELRGDRAGADDPACVAALAVTIHGTKTLVLALDRSRAPGPHAYRKAVRCVRIASRLGLPVVTLVDTRGADPSESSEAGGVAWAIAELYETMLSAPVPVVSIVTGEGGSGGALAFACGDALLAYEGAVFEVIAPELAAQILWRDDGRAGEAARLLRIGARDLAALDVCDEVLAGRPDAGSLSAAVAYHLGRLEAMPDAARDAARRERWRQALGYR